MIPEERVATITQEVCERIADGQSLRHICDSEHMPDLATIKRWLRQDEAFRTQYTQARP